MKTVSTDVVVSGGGPGGIFLGHLLAKQGINAIVLEKHRDFLRDWRGDTVHPATLKLLDELGLGEKFREIPSARMRSMRVDYDGFSTMVAEFRGLPLAYDYIAMVPQWDLLELVARESRHLPAFDLWMEAEVESLTYSKGRVSGVRGRRADGEVFEIEASLVVGADGRWSTIRRELGISFNDTSTPMDVWQVRIPKEHLPEVEEQAHGSYVAGAGAVAMNRDSYLQVGFLLPKGKNEEYRARDISWLRSKLQELFGWPDAAVNAITSWDDVPYLKVMSGCATKWSRPGAIIIGDAVHPMSPAGGVGVNLAIQDAVGLSVSIGRHGLDVRAHRNVLLRRQAAARFIQFLQREEHRNVIAPALSAQPGQRLGVPLFLRIQRQALAARRFAAWASVVGSLPEKWEPAGRSARV